MAVSLGFASDAIVQEFYVDDDVDQKVRESIEQETGHPLVDVDYGDVVDGVLIRCAWATLRRPQRSRACTRRRRRRWVRSGRACA